MSAPEPLLAARGVARRFGAHQALHQTDLAVYAGEAVALVGPNGAGKSTLLAMLAGALDPSAGAVDRGVGVRVGWAPQRPGHYGRLSAEENLELFARLDGLADPQAEADSLVAALGIPRAHGPSEQLSAGNRQRLNVALALVGEPRVLLLDEPTAALDEGGRRAIWERAEELLAAGGALAFASQETPEVRRYAQRVVVLERGRIVPAP